MKDEKTRKKRALRSAPPHDHHLPHLMVSLRTLSSHSLELNPQNPNHVSLYAWMKHEDWKLLHHLKSKLKIIYNLILSCILLISLSHVILWIFARMAKSISSLEARLLKGASILYLGDLGIIKFYS